MIVFLEILIVILIILLAWDIIRTYFITVINKWHVFLQLIIALGALSGIVFSIVTFKQNENQFRQTVDQAEKHFRTTTDQIKRNFQETVRQSNNQESWGQTPIKL